MTSEEKYDKRKIAEKAFDKLGDKEVNPALKANVLNAYRRETGFYLNPDRKQIPSYLWKKKGDYSGKEYEKGRKERETIIIKNLDPAGAAFEEAGDYVAARNSRIAQAKTLTSKNNENYSSAGLLYESAGELKSAINSYKSLLEKYTQYEQPYAVPIARAKISELEKKIEAQDNRIKRKLSIAASIFSILGGLFFLSPNLTGNAISNMTTQTASWIGAVLIIIGIIALYFLMKAKKITNKKQEQMIPIKKISKKKKI